MTFKIDHDYHIHSLLSSCSQDPGQTTEAILKYAEKNDFSEICVTDHFWDGSVPGASGWYEPQNFAHVAKSLPLPQSENVKFYFGCETELDKNMTLGISDKTMDKFDFIIIPTTHFHMTGFTVDAEKTSVGDRAELYIEKLDKLLDKDLPFTKIGIAHLTCDLMAYNHRTDFDEHMRILDAISDEDFKSVFSKLAEKGAGFELNFSPASYSEEQLPRVLRPYRIAKEVGCKFYLGSDAHHPSTFERANIRFARIVELLELEEKDRFRFCR